MSFLSYLLLMLAQVSQKWKVCISFKINKIDFDLVQVNHLI